MVAINDSKALMQRGELQSGGSRRDLEAHQEDDLYHLVNVSNWVQNRQK
jgi:hypothetical protein